MRFRPCIDIHNGKVKQIVGGSLRDSGDEARENYISSQGAEYFAQLYKEDGLKGGHVILLNPPSSDYFGATKRQALAALEAYPGGLQIGGGITAENAEEYLEAGASHVIVTSYVFLDGEVRLDRMERLKNTVGRERVVIDLSCRKKDGDYYIVTNRWQTFTQVRLTREIMDEIIVKVDPKLSMHDFRILSAPNYVNLIFDLVVPPEIDDEKGHEKIESYLKEKVTGFDGKTPYFVINFDDSISDFLYDTGEEKTDI